VKVPTFLTVVIFCVAACEGGSAAAARADLRFCNQTTTPSEVIEAHVIPRQGLTVTGTVTVKAGRCGIVVPGRLTAPNYFVHVDNAGLAYGGTAHLCVLTMYSFHFEEEDASGFRCNSRRNEFIRGVKERLENFFGFNMGHSTTLTVTQRRNRTFHYQFN
jgi:uncharacterized membrane protein